MGTWDFFNFQRELEMFRKVPNPTGKKKVQGGGLNNGVGIDSDLIRFDCFYWKPIEIVLFISVIVAEYSGIADNFEKKNTQCIVAVSKTNMIP